MTPESPGCVLPKELALLCPPSGTVGELRAALPILVTAKVLTAKQVATAAVYQMWAASDSAFMFVTLSQLKVTAAGLFPWSNVVSCPGIQNLQWMKDMLHAPVFTASWHGHWKCWILDRYHLTHLSYRDFIQRLATFSRTFSYIYRRNVGLLLHVAAFSFHTANLNNFIKRKKIFHNSCHVLVPSLHAGGLSCPGERERLSHRNTQVQFSSRSRIQFII